MKGKGGEVLDNNFNISKSSKKANTAHGSRRRLFIYKVHVFCLTDFNLKSQDISYEMEMMGLLEKTGSRRSLQTRF